MGKLRTGYLKKISDVKVVLAQDLYPGWYMDLNHIRPDSIISTHSVVRYEKVTSYTYTYKAINGTGNTLDNQITGSNGRNTLSGLEGNDSLSGLEGDDKLLGGLGDDLLQGGAGRDTLDGGHGQDILTGDGGNDTFRFTALDDSPAGLLRDTITDLEKGDRIDLRSVDANSLVRGNQAFRYIKDADFSGRAGELRFDPNSHLLQADSNGDGIPDMEILLTGITTISSGQIQL